MVADSAVAGSFTVWFCDFFYILSFPNIFVFLAYFIIFDSILYFVYRKNRKNWRRLLPCFYFVQRMWTFISSLEDKVRWLCFRFYQVLSLLGPVLLLYEQWARWVHLLYSLNLLVFSPQNSEVEGGENNRNAIQKILYLGVLQTNPFLSVPTIANGSIGLFFAFRKSSLLPDVCPRKLIKFAAKLWRSLLCGNQFNKDLCMCVHFSLIW